MEIIKGLDSYKITILPELEQKIRVLCNKLPNNEYSGTLFYKIEGSFEDKSLNVIAVDFYIQDIGSGTYTEFQNDDTLAQYMVSHDLFDCYTGLLHSHNRMAK